MKRVCNGPRFASRKNKAVSEVVGAMLLMIVVVVAVGTFAYYLSNLQSQTQNRQNFLNSVANDRLQVTNLQFALNNSRIQYEIYSLTNITKYYVQMINSTAVKLINETSGNLYHAANLTASNLGSPPVIQAHYNSINFSATGNLSTSLSGAVSFIFKPSSSPGVWAFRTATWGNATITVRNLNTLQSGIRAIQINGNYLRNYWYTANQNGLIQKSLFPNGSILAQPYNLTSPSIVVPARASLSILVNLGYLNIPRNESFTITLLSTANNFFVTFYGPPTATIKGSVTTENYFVTSRDIPTFDASGSLGSNGSAVKAFIWQIDVPNATWKGSWSQIGSIYTNFTYGQTLQFRPEALYSPALLAGLATPLFNTTFRVTLTTVDQYGFMTTSQPTILPSDPNTSPAGSVSYVSGGCTTGPVQVEVKDIFGRPLENVPVQFIGLDGAVPSPTFNVTSASGIAQTSCTGAGFLETIAGSLTPSYFAVS